MTLSDPVAVLPLVLLPLQAACHKERHVSQKAVSFIHDVLIEVLSSWAELPHFHFNEALFRPFEHIMQLELCDEDVQDQVNRTPMPVQFLSRYYYQTVHAVRMTRPSFSSMTANIYFV